MSDLWKRLAELELSIESYELEPLGFELSEEFTRLTTVVRMRGGGHDGVGEDVTYTGLDQIALRDAGPVHDLSAVRTLGELCTRLDLLDLFPGAPPEMESSRHYRRWAFESAALDLALRQAGLALWQVVERDPQPVTFVCSTRLTPLGGEASAATSAEAVLRRLERYPGLRFKLDPENDWDERLIAELAGLDCVDTLDLKGHYKGTPVDVETDPELYAAVAEAFPDAWLEDPDLSDETRPVLEPHLDRLTWDAPLHSLIDIVSLEHEPKAINSKPSRFGSIAELCSVYAHCEAAGISVYGGGQSELGPGRGQIQYLASLFHPQTANDVAPSGFNDPSVPEGLPTSPLEPAPSKTGFRWAE